MQSPLAQLIGQRYSIQCSMDISSIFCVLHALKSPTLGSRAIQTDDEIIVSAITSPAIIGTIMALGCVPVLVDISLPYGNPPPHHISKSLTERTKVILLEHTLGNPLDTVSIREIAEANNIYFIELCGNYYGASFLGNKIGTFGDISIWDREILTDSTFMGEILQSSVDLFGCLGIDVKQFELPNDLDELGNTHRNNWLYLKSHLSGLSRYFILPDFIEHAEPDWGGFALTIKFDVGVRRTELIDCLNNVGGVGTVLPDSSIDWLERTSYPNKHADTPKAKIFSTNTFFLGTSEWMTQERLENAVGHIKYFLGEIG